MSSPSIEPLPRRQPQQRRPTRPGALSCCTAAIQDVRRLVAFIDEEHHVKSGLTQR